MTDLTKPIKVDAEDTAQMQVAVGRVNALKIASSDRRMRFALAAEAEAKAEVKAIEEVRGAVTAADQFAEVMRARYDAGKHGRFNPITGEFPPAVDSTPAPKEDGETAAKE